MNQTIHLDKLYKNRKPFYTVHIIRAYKKQKVTYLILWNLSLKRIAYRLCIFSLLALIWMSMMPIASAQTITKTVTLPNFNVDINFPSEGNPGETIIVSVTATAKENVKLGELTIHIYAYTGYGEQRTILIDAIAKDTRVRNGEMFHKTYTIVLPADIPRSPLMATILERARTYKTVYTSYAIWWPPPWWNYSWPWWPYWVVPYRYSYTKEQTTFTSLPLTYVKATTPEYAQLKSEYDSLSESYSALQSEHESLKGKYNRLKEDHESLKTSHQAAISENNILKAELESTKAQLAETRDLMYIFAMTTAVFAATTLLLVALTPKATERSQTTARRPRRVGT